MKLTDVRIGDHLTSYKEFQGFKKCRIFEVINIHNSVPKHYILKYKELFKKDYIFYISEIELKKYFKFDLTKKEKRNLKLENILL